MTQLSADRPIETEEEDILGHARFAGLLAQGILERAPADGLIVGMEASWGMGKTSALNLLVRAIERHEQHQLEQHRTRVLR